MRGVAARRAGLAAGIALREHVRRVRPDWPTERDRTKTSPTT
jgi:hypothetical protein